MARRYAPPKQCAIESMMGIDDFVEIMVDTFAKESLRVRVMRSGSARQIYEASRRYLFEENPDFAELKNCLRLICEAGGPATHMQLASVLYAGALAVMSATASAENRVREADANQETN